MIACGGGAGHHLTHSSGSLGRGSSRQSTPTHSRTDRTVVKWKCSEWGSNPDPLTLSGDDGLVQNLLTIICQTFRGLFYYHYFLLFFFYMRNLFELYKILQLFWRVSFHYLFNDYRRLCFPKKRELKLVSLVSMSKIMIMY